jgi:hypothetical protein
MRRCEHILGACLEGGGQFVPPLALEIGTLRLQGGMAGLLNAFFPLTPTLSLREGETRSTVFEQYERARTIEGRRGSFPLPEGEGPRVRGKGAAEIRCQRNTEFTISADSAVGAGIIETYRA